jgi:hypothetical protein
MVCSGVLVAESVELATLCEEHFELLRAAIVSPGGAGFPGTGMTGV